jgi:hypothetical protein
VDLLLGKNRDRSELPRIHAMNYTNLTKECAVKSVQLDILRCKPNHNSYCCTTGHWDVPTITRITGGDTSSLFDKPGRYRSLEL